MGRREAGIAIAEDTMKLLTLMVSKVEDGVTESDAFPEMGRRLFCEYPKGFKIILFHFKSM